jgi:hypothetical protein
MMGKRHGAKDNQHQGTTGTLEGNKEIGHRSWYRRIRISRRGAQKGVAEEMTEDRKGWVKLFEIEPSKMKDGTCEIKASGADSSRKYAACKNGNKITIYPVEKEE